MPEIRCDIEPIGTRTVVSISGELCLPTVPQVRAALLKSLVDEPDALIVDLSALTVTVTATSVFAAAARNAAHWPGTPLIISAPAPVAAILARTCPRIPVFASVDEALGAEFRHRMPSVRDRLLPVSGAARRARDLAAEACTQWGLPHLIAPAGLIAGELVTNAAVHAETMADLLISLDPRYLTIAVRDGSTAPPVLPPGPSPDPAAPRGLLLVEATARRWGSRRTEDGKVVWAVLGRA